MSTALQPFTLPFLQTINPPLFPHLSLELEFLNARTNLGSYFELQFRNRNIQDHNAIVANALTPATRAIADALAGPVVTQLASIATGANVWPLEVRTLFNNRLGELVSQVQGLNTKMSDAAPSVFTRLADETASIRRGLGEGFGPIFLRMMLAQEQLAGSGTGFGNPAARLAFFNQGGYVPPGLINITAVPSVAEITASVQAWGAREITGAVKFLNDNVWPGLVRILDPLLTAGSELLETLGTATSDLFKSTFGAATAGLLTHVTRRLEALGPIAPGDQRAVSAELLGDAFGLGIAAHATAWIAESVYFTKHLGLPQFAAFMVDLAGFQAIARAEIGAHIDAGIGAPARYHANSIYRSRMPDLNSAIDQASRRYLPLQDLEHVIRWHGLPQWAEDATLRAMWTDPNLNAIGRLLDDSEPDEAWLVKKLRSAGLEDEDVDRAHDQLLRNATKSLRQAYLSSIVIAYREGLMSDAELDGEMELLGMGDLGRSLVLKRARLERRRDLLNDQVRAFKALADDQIMSLSDYRLALVGLGLDADRADVLVAQVDAKIRGRIAVQVDARIEKELRDLQGLRARQAAESFARGLLTQAELQTLLVQIGFDPEQAQAFAALEAVKVAPLPRRPAQLTAAAQREIEDQIIESTILDSLRRQLISTDGARSALRALGLPDREIDAKIQRELILRAPAPTRIPIESPVVVRTRQLQTEAAIAEFREGKIQLPALRAKLQGLGYPSDVVQGFLDRESARLPLPVPPAPPAPPALTAEQRRLQSITESTVKELLKQGILTAGQAVSFLVNAGIARPVAQAIVDLEEIRREGRA